MVFYYLYQLFAVIIVVSVTIYLYLKWLNTYWQRRNTPFLPPRLLLGNLKNPLNDLQSIGVQCREIYEEVKRKGLGNIGCYIFTSPMYLITDLDLVRDVLVKDFGYFEDRGGYYNPNETIASHLIVIEGDNKWRNIRSRMSPSFTSIKLKQIYDILLNSSKDLVEAIDRALVISKEIDLRDMMNSFTIDNIASSAFGLETKSFTTIQNDFKKYGVMAIQPGTKQDLINLFCFVAPNLCRKLNIKTFRKGINDFFVNIVTETITYREKNNVRRNDFLQQMIEMMKDTDPEKRISLECVIAQCFVFFIAGYETSSTTLMFAILEMSEYPEVQQMAREEVLDVAERFGGKLTYDALTEMKYLGQVIDETLRKYPAAPVHMRKCTKEYQVPNTDIILEKGTQVAIPVLGIQNDPEIFSKPDVFDPDRFSEDNKKKIHPGSYTPFGDGPRICLGLRLAILQVKLGLAVILKNYKFSPNPKTRLPVKFKSNFLLAIKGDVFINVEKYN